MTLARRLLAWAGVALLLACAVALALRWVDAASVPVVVVQSALPLVAIVAVVASLLLLAVRRPWLAAAGLVLVLGFGATGLPSLRRTTVAPQKDDLTVVAINLEYGGGDAGQVMAEVHRLDADVVILVEVTPAALARFEAQGLTAWEHQVGIPLDNAAGLVVRTRLPMDNIDWGEGYPQPWTGAVGRITTPAGTVVVRGVHTNAPNLHDATRWRASMTELGTWAHERHEGEAVLMAGDFNSGWGHPAFRSAVAGYSDAHRAAGQGWVRTWPQGHRVPSFTQLDHVLVRGLDVVDAGTFTVDGTDHAGVWATVRTH